MHRCVSPPALKRYIDVLRVAILVSVKSLDSSRVTAFIDHSCSVHFNVFFFIGLDAYTFIR